MKLSIILSPPIETWYENGFVGVIEAARAMDAAGVDVLMLPEHLAMANDMEQFERRYGKAPINPYSEFMEPMVYLGAISTVTKTIRLGTSIILAPLRTTLSLAKQIATLDYVSGGRAFMGIGAGWQKQEFDATGMPWKGRYQLMVEQVQAFRKLWTEAPATYRGEYIQFEDLNMLPFPPQGANLPMLFGLIDNDRNFGWMADNGVGWLPMHIRDPALLAEPIRKLKAAYKAKGHDPESFEIIGMADVVIDADGRFDLDRTLAKVDQYREAGVTALQLSPLGFCSGPQELSGFLDKTVRAVKG